MFSLPLSYLERHLFVEVQGQKWLLDTGSPTTFGNSTSLRLGGDEYPVANSGMGITVDSLTEHVPVEMVGLLGMDVLGQYDFVLDLPNHRLLLSREPIEREGVTLDLDEYMDVPLVYATVRGQELRMFLDTGAMISFLQKDLVSDLKPVGSFVDFYPMHGTFETPLFKLEHELGGVRFVASAGVLPEFLNMMLSLAGADGVLGNQFLVQRPVLLSLRNRVAVLLDPDPKDEGGPEAAP
ncbi:MAG: hypothetical protein KatS3mg015_0276 [Fimbriimonadales bacterium]|nr:MAG: hypothetical protein KatS3mg015_0276 [Fimbriimonadales bacterium]